MTIKDKKPKKNLAEHSFRLSLSDFGRGLLLSRNKIENENLYFLSKEDGGLVGSSGRIKLKNGAQTIYLIFNVNLNKTPKKLVIYFTTDPTNSNKTITQEINLSESVVSFGVRSYFHCECGRDVSVLYLPSSKQSLFKCRICSNISYESCNINKNSMNGLLYAIYSLVKLADKREKIERIHYAGKLTKKGQALVVEHNKWNAMVKGQREALLSAYKILNEAI
ncbi:MAG: hypothetical protein U9M94_01590 [Patescibacteria group bacterium]|nr:hypothetical protein [Patescibacteria group bacterium]